MNIERDVYKLTYSSAQRLGSSDSGEGERDAFVIIAQLGKTHNVPAAAEPLSAGAGVRPCVSVC